MFYFIVLYCIVFFFCESKKFSKRSSNRDTRDSNGAAARESAVRHWWLLDLDVFLCGFGHRSLYSREGDSLYLLRKRAENTFSLHAQTGARAHLSHFFRREARSSEETCCNSR